MAGRRRPRATTVVALLLVGATVAGGAGCSQLTSDQLFPGACAPFAVVSSVPADGADQVPVDTTISLTFSDFPDPDTVGLSTVVLSSGVQTRLGGVAVDLITRSIRFQIRNQLSANLSYLVTVLPGVRSLTGCPTKSDQRTFRTGSGPTDPPVPPAPIPAFSEDVLPIFAARCAGAGCHRAADSGDGCLAHPPMGLSLCDRDAWAALVNADATELAGIKRVLPGDPARSYLMRKLVSDPAGGPVPTTPGHRDPPDAPLDGVSLRAISDWIEGGAAQ